jgi:molybdopterin-guanine dinucleotide biosynthesis protein
MAMADKTLTLRPYGPGKFDLMLDAYLYELSLNGPDDEAGDVDEYGYHYCLLRGFAVDEPFSDVAVGRLTDDERAFLQQQAGAIIETDSQGFVTVEYFPTESKLDLAWTGIEQAIAKVMAPDDN